PCDAPPPRLGGRPQAGPPALERAGPATADPAAKAAETRAQARGRRQSVHGEAGAVQGRRVDRRLHPRPDGRRPAAQVVDAGGGFHRGAPGAAGGGGAGRGRRPAAGGGGDRSGRGAGADPQRQRLGVHRRRAGGLAAGGGDRADPGGGGQPVGGRVHRVVPQPAAGRVPGAGGVRVGGRRAGEGVVVPAGGQGGGGAQLAGLRDAEGVQRGL